MSKIPTTKFNMRGELIKLDTKIQFTWEKNQIMNKFFTWSDNKPTKLFICGPPYANGFLHTGHKINFILKDIYNQWWRSQGYNVTHLAGFDCHGRPIEMKINPSINANSDELVIQNHIQKCKQLAENNIQEQYNQLGSLGIFLQTEINGKFIPYYATIHEYVSIYEAFSESLLNNRIYAQLRPMLWSIDDASVISEIETEYRNIVSTSVYVALQIQHTQDKLVIWTTTPWTLIDNAAVAYNTALKYVKISTNGNNYIICKNLVESFCTKLKIVNPTIIDYELSHNMTCEHPIIDNKFVPILHGSHVTNVIGTGFVHTAPAHGLEDYQMSIDHKFEFTESVNAEGFYYTHTPKVSQLHIFKNKAQILETVGNKCIFQEEYEHSYPHALRTNTPIIYRASNQIFANLDNIDLEGVKSVYTMPHHLAKGLYDYVKDRKEWCLSRNRTWGVPLALIIDKQTNIVYKDLEFQKKIISQMSIDPYIFLSRSKFQKFVNDHVANAVKYDLYLGVLDVWFDSACAYDIVSKLLNVPNMPSTFIEGVDQKRGWFQSSLLGRLLQEKSIPYNTIISHGFVVDGNGRKLSKSLGNTQVVENIINKYGNEILRIRMASCDYTTEISIGETIMNQCAEMYRKIRNVMRYLISVCETYTLDIIPTSLPEIENIYIWKMYDMKEKFIESMNKSHFSEAFEVFNNFIVEISSDYFNACKVSLYETNDYSHIVFTMNLMLMELLNLIKCVLSVTSEEIFIHLQGIKLHDMWNNYINKESIHLVELQDIYIYKHINMKKIYEHYMEITQNISKEMSIINVNTGYEAQYKLHVKSTLCHIETLRRRFGFAMASIKEDCEQEVMIIKYDTNIKS